MTPAQLRLCHMPHAGRQGARPSVLNFTPTCESDPRPSPTPGSESAITAIGGKGMKSGDQSFQTLLREGACPDGGEVTCTLT